MKIHFLKLTNFRCFELLPIGFHPDLTVIVGANGAGKTAILDALAIVLSIYLTKIDDGKVNKLEPKDARSLRLSPDSLNMESQYPIELEAIGQFPLGKIQISEEWYYQVPLLKSEEKKSIFGLLNQSKPSDPINGLKINNNLDKLNLDLHYWSCGLSTPKSRTKAMTHHLIAYGDDMQASARASNNLLLPLLAYYGANRALQFKAPEVKRHHILSESRSFGYHDCLNTAPNYKAFVQWYKELELALAQAKGRESQGQKESYVSTLVTLKEAIQETINHCLIETGWNGIEYDFAIEQVTLQHPTQGIIPITQLSDGIRSVLALAADIAFRCCKLNGHIGAQAAKEAVKQTPGIVMIDELDLHLHPSWQQTIVPAFQKAFPQIQFIITTHSPHLLSTVPSECIRILQDGQILQPHIETEGEQSRAVLEDVFGVSAWPPMQIAAKLKDYLRLVDHQEYDTLEGKALRAELEDHYGKGHVELAMADIVIMRYEALKQARQSRA